MNRGPTTGRRGWLAAGAALLCACHPKDVPPVTDTGLGVGTLGLRVAVEVDGEAMFTGVANAPAYGLYQPPREGANCVPARRVSAIQGDAVFVDMVFPGEHPEVGSQVRFPAQPDSDAADWSAASWVDDAGQAWAVYGGLATLERYDAGGVELSLFQATVCRSDRVGRIDPALDGTWSTHTSDCAEHEDVVFRTLEALPFDFERPPWCAAGRARSWATRDAEPLCSELAEPCEVTLE